LLADTDLLENIERGSWPLGKGTLHSSPAEIQTLVAQTIQVKITFVQKDPFDQGIRSHLNLGHTFAHAIEQVSANTVRHGEAVAMGLAAAADLSLRLGYCTRQLKDSIDHVLSKVGLPNRIPASHSPELILEAMGRDKKRSAQSIRLVLLVKAGQVFVADDVPTADILKTLQAISSSTATPSE
jgi:3-dehydroquinate synthetase